MFSATICSHYMIIICLYSGLSRINGFPYKQYRDTAQFLKRDHG